LKLPATVAVDGSRQLPLDGREKSTQVTAIPFQTDRCRGGRVLAKTADGKAICVAQDRGAGRLIYLSVPHAPVNWPAGSADGGPVDGSPNAWRDADRRGRRRGMAGQQDANRLGGDAAQSGWPAQAAARHSTDRLCENRPVTITAKVPIKKAYDRLLPTDVFPVDKNTMKCEVLAGSVRVIVLE